MSLSIGVIIPTYNAANILHRVIEPVAASPLNPRILVIDSSSQDDTASVARSLGAEVLVIPKAEFNHGRTRELGRQYLKTDVVVMMTQDIIPENPDTLSFLVAPVLDGTAAVSYARQIPHDSAPLLEAYPRAFNYPNCSELRGLNDISQYGAYTFFCSNSCAAWLSKTLDEVGGFGNTQSLEDTIAVAKLLRLGHKISYTSNAVVKHSHNYTFLQEFQRYFVTGYVRAQNRSLLFASGGDGGRGVSYTKSLLVHLLKRAPQLIPRALTVNFVKLAGYMLGYYGQNLPVRFRRAFSGIENFE